MTRDFDLVGDSIVARRRGTQLDVEMFGDFSGNSSERMGQAPTDDGDLSERMDETVIDGIGINLGVGPFNNVVSKFFLLGFEGDGSPHGVPTRKRTAVATPRSMASSSSGRPLSKEASAGRRSPTRLKREDDPKLAAGADEQDKIMAADGERGGDEDIEEIPGLLGTGRWRRLKGGVTMDSGC